MPTKKSRPRSSSQHPQPDNDAITKHLQDLLSPAIYAQSAYYRSLGLRERILNLTLMVAAVLTLIWRQVPSVQELSRMLEQQELLWKNSQSLTTHCHKGFSVFQPSCLSMFFMTCCHSYKHVGTKGKTTSSVAVKYAHKHFENIWIADGSTKHCFASWKAFKMHHKVN